MIKRVIYKPRSVGHSLVAREQPALQLQHLLFHLPVLPFGGGREGNRSMLVGQIALVEYLKNPPVELKVPGYVKVIHQRLADVIDLSAGIFTVEVLQEENLLDGERTGGEVDLATFRVFPDSVEFGFDELAREFPNTPARKLSSTMAGHMLWNDRETFLQWLSGQGTVLHQDRGTTSHNGVAEI